MSRRAAMRLALPRKRSGQPPAASARPRTVVATTQRCVLRAACCVLRAACVIANPPPSPAPRMELASREPLPTSRAGLSNAIRCEQVRYEVCARSVRRRCLWTSPRPSTRLRGVAARQIEHEARAGVVAFGQAVGAVDSPSNGSTRRCPYGIGVSTSTSISVQRASVASPVMKTSAPSSIAVPRWIASGDRNPYRARSSVARSMIAAVTSTMRVRANAASYSASRAASRSRVGLDLHSSREIRDVKRPAVAGSALRRASTAER